MTDSVAGSLLKKYGITPETIRQKVVKIVGKGAEDGRVDTPTGTPNLDKVGRDLTEMARAGKLDPVLGRAQEIENTIEVLARRKKNNPVLIGEPAWVKRLSLKDWHNVSSKGMFRKSFAISDLSRSI